MPKIFSYTICHYGKDYLSWCLRAVQPVVDRSYVLYTSHPSHGHSSDIQPIETREEIMSSIPADEWDKLIWIDTENFWHEGRQRDFAVSTLTEAGADLILCMDYDECWPKQTLVNVLNHVWRENKVRSWLINFSHLWRSFDYIIRDDAWPVRIFDLRHSDGLAYVSRELGPIYHLGYAVTDEVMSYKWECHGHKDELRRDWFETKWAAWPPVEDCHPTNGRKADGTGWWNPEPFDKNELPDILKSHPFWGVDRIE